MVGRAGGVGGTLSASVDMCGAWGKMTGKHQGSFLASGEWGWEAEMDMEEMLLFLSCSMI